MACGTVLRPSSHLCSDAQCLLFLLCTLTAAVLLGALLPWLQASLLPQTCYLPLIKAFSEGGCFDPGLWYVVLFALPYLHVELKRLALAGLPALATYLLGT